jgi:hypothetical protein
VRQLTLIVVASVLMFTGTLAKADEMPPRGAAEVAPRQSSVPSVPPQSNQTPGPSPGATETPPVQETVQPPSGSAIQSVSPNQAEAILGQPVTDAEGKDIGRLVDVLVDANGQPQAAVIDFGGFMGVGNRKIAVHWSVIRFNPGDLKHKVTLEMTPNQIKAAPEFLNPNKAAAVVTPASPVAPAGPVPPQTTAAPVNPAPTSP